MSCATTLTWLRNRATGPSSQTARGSGCCDVAPEVHRAQRLAGRPLDQLVPAHRQTGGEHPLGEKPSGLGTVDEATTLALERRGELRGDDVAEEIGVVVDGRAGDVDLCRP